MCLDRLGVRRIIEAQRKFQDIVDVHGGANSYAFRARHQQLGRDCFLKLIDFPEEGEDTILREPRALVAALQGQPRCENIVTLYDAEVLQCDNERYVLLQMEWLDGQSLQHQIETRCFGQQDAVRIAMGVLRGVAHLHAKQLVHRDLKPGNILLTATTPPTPRIADFGSVAHAQDGRGVVSASKHSDLYVPFEAWNQPPQYCYQSDLYQVGLVLHQLICGPFPTEGRAYVTRAVHRDLKLSGQAYEQLDSFGKCTVERQSFAELTRREVLVEHTGVSRPYMSAAVKKIIRRATKADLSERFSSAVEFLNQLSRICVPNWVCNDGCFLALGWSGWDWKVQTERQETIVVLRSRPGACNFRRFEKVSDLHAAFALVESHAA